MKSSKIYIWLVAFIVITISFGACNNNDTIVAPAKNTLKSVSYNPNSITITEGQDAVSSTLKLNPSEASATFAITKITKDGVTFLNTKNTFTVDDKGKISSNTNKKPAAGVYVLTITATDKSNAIVKKAADFTITVKANAAVGSESEITLYKVTGETIEKITDYKVTGQNLAYQKDVAKHQELWALIKKVMPNNYRTKMSEFLIYNGSANGTAGFVVQTKQDLSKWQMGIAINFADDKKQLTYTVIHEFGHILTLNNDQVNASITSSACKNYFVGEGCAKSASYINKLHKNFWADIWSEFQTAQDDQSAHQAFYEKHKDRFVTNYAATNPGEDIAEVFATFVTRNDKPSGATIAEKNYY